MMQNVKKVFQISWEYKKGHYANRESFKISLLEKVQDPWFGF
jgi:hypothetical protein